MLRECLILSLNSTSQQSRARSTRACRIKTTTIGTIGNALESCRVDWRFCLGLFELQLCCILKHNVLIYFLPHQKHRVEG